MSTDPGDQCDGDQPLGGEFAADFRLSMTRALRSQLIETLEALDWAQLSRANLNRLQARAGVYQLALDGAPVYVGKADDSLPGRLADHLKKLSGRTADQSGRAPAQRVSFRCCYVDEDLAAVAPERMLIAALGDRGEAAWNKMGFGSNDPGRNRDRTLVKLGHFDRVFPIDLNHAVTLDPPIGPTTLVKVMNSVKRELPYTYRFAKGAPDVPVEPSDLPPGYAGTAGEWFEAFAALLPEGWVHVCLPGYVIAYPGLVESDFGSRSATWRSTGGSAAYSSHEADFAEGSPADVEAGEGE